FGFDDLNVVWTHRSWGNAPDPEYPWAGIIYGTKGTLKLSVNKYDFIPRGRGEKLHGEALIETDKFPTDATDVKDWKMELHVASAIRGHMQNFLNCIDDRSRPIADIEQGHISSASCFMANNSMTLGRSLAFDPKTHSIIGDDEATAALKRPYRKPYIHPASTA
ncbi:MAG: gfo/Idh/MocA family oxidoreductase, partial [Planctomycetota bacterium]